MQMHFHFKQASLYRGTQNTVNLLCVYQQLWAIIKLCWCSYWEITLIRVHPVAKNHDCHRFNYGFSSVYLWIYFFCCLSFSLYNITLQQRQLLFNWTSLFQSVLLMASLSESVQSDCFIFCLRPWHSGLRKMTIKAYKTAQMLYLLILVCWTDVNLGGHNLVQVQPI